MTETTDTEEDLNEVDIPVDLTEVADSSPNDVDLLDVVDYGSKLPDPKSRGRRGSKGL